ncbi:maleate cis-trans isomerase family protein [Streptomyces lasalocidi]
MWACTSGSFVHGWDGARDQVRALAQVAGMPASSTSFAFVHAAQEIGVRRVAVGATYPEDVAGLFAGFLRAAWSGGDRGAPVRDRHGGRGRHVGEQEVLALARAADGSGAQAILLPDTALHTAAYLPRLERELGKPVLTANQVTVWEGLRLADRRVNAPRLGTLFTREPIIQV